LPIIHQEVRDNSIEPSDRVVMRTTWCIEHGAWQTLNALQMLTGHLHHEPRKFGVASTHTCQVPNEDLQPKSKEWPSPEESPSACCLKEGVQPGQDGSEQVASSGIWPGCLLVTKTRLGAIYKGKPWN
jgi:hypothetical protein